MNKKLSVSVALTITLLAMTLTFSITMIISMNLFDKTVSSVVQKQAMYDKLSEVDTYVRGNFYGEVDEVLLGDRIARGYVDGVGDKYSVYYSEKEYTEMRLIDSGDLVGIGIELARDADNLFRIIKVYAGSPAEKAGVKAGGQIMQLGDVDAATLTTSRAIRSALLGEPGTTLELTCVYPPSEEQIFIIQREEYRAPTVERTMTKNYAYIRVSSFEAATANDFEYEVQQAGAEGARGILFDLRDNSGGAYDSAYKMIDMLCPNGTVAKREIKSGVTSVLATSDENEIKLPMAVLVNENTGAAAELFAVSLRDLSGGSIAGMTTAGHGAMQATPYRLSDGSAVSITVAKILTGKNESFDMVGLIPDVEIAGGEFDSHLTQPDFAKDTQIVRAMAALRMLANDNEADEILPSEKVELVGNVVSASGAASGAESGASSGVAQSGTSSGAAQSGTSSGAAQSGTSSGAAQSGKTSSAAQSGTSSSKAQSSSGAKQ